jgi:hypothetical protein
MYPGLRVIRATVTGVADQVKNSGHRGARAAGRDLTILLSARTLPSNGGGLGRASHGGGSEYGGAVKLYHTTDAAEAILANGFRRLKLLLGE